MKSFKEFLLIERMTEKLWDLFKAKISNIEHFVPNEKDAKIVFDILNKQVFGNRLENIKIKVEHFNANKHKNQDGKFFVGTCRLLFYDDKVLNFSKTSMSDKDFRSMYKNDGILITFYSKTTFERFVAIMAHEMIHQLEIIDPNEKLKIYFHMLMKNLGHDFKYKFHGDFFTKEMKRINENFGLDIEPTETMDEKDLEEMAKEIDSLSGIIEEDSVKDLPEEKQRTIRKLALRMRKHLDNDGTTLVKATKSGVYLYIF